MNYVVLIGRIVNNLEKIEENENIQTYITVEVQRPFKNSNGIYETDFIKCLLGDEWAKKALEYLKKGDMIGIKGRLTSDYVVAEKITFLSSKEVK